MVDVVGMTIEPRHVVLGSHLLPRNARGGKAAANAAAASRAECSIGVMAYNEEANIANALESMLQQQLSSAHIAELIVVASGCEDRTPEIVRDITQRDPRVRLIEQRRRLGKASAINLFIEAARSGVLLMVSADVIVESGTLDALLRHFEDPTVGMAGGHPTPVNSDATFLGHAVHLQWRLHDRIARRTPKLGEIVAFRNVVPSIPLDTAVDEISIQALITQLGYRVVYEPQAVVYNRGPTTVRDFLRQRRRIYAGHLRVREQQDYSASTMSNAVLARAMWGSGSVATPRTALWTIGAVALEATARALGHYDIARGRSQHVWEMSTTTKQHIAEGANAGSQLNVAVFHMTDFHRRQLELGTHATRQLTRRVADHIKRALGTDTTVSIQHGGTIVALVRGDRDVAERSAQDVVQHLGSTRLALNGHRETVLVTLACGLIAFPQSGPALTRPIPLPALEAGPATSMAT